MNIIIIGMGNVGQLLATKLLEEGHSLIQCYNRTTLTSESKNELWFNLLTHNWKDLKQNADIVILSVVDDAIKKTSSKLPHRIKEKALIVHTSGFYGREVLSDDIVHKGIFYPLNSFTVGSTVEWDRTPFFLTASNQRIKWLRTIAESITHEIYEVDEQQKAVLHLAAVLVNNFTNALFTMAERLLRDKDLDLKPLLPLIETTVEKIKRISPEEAQTGPAVRADRTTVLKHLSLLKDHPEEYKIYRLLTHYINPKAIDHEDR